VYVDVVDMCATPRQACCGECYRELGMWKMGCTIAGVVDGAVLVKVYVDCFLVIHAQAKLRSLPTMPRSSSLTDLLNFTEQKPAKRRAFVPTSEQLARLPLEPGQNTIDFTFGRTRLRAYVYYFHWSSRFASASEILGTLLSEFLSP
jgi:hypothetical protein